MKNNKILEIKIECYLNHWYPLYPFYIYTTIKFDLNDNIPIKDRINDFLKSKGIDNPNKKYIYLFKEEHAIMKFDPNKPISQISDNKGDKILLSDKEYKVKNEVNEVIIHQPKINIEDDKSSTRKIAAPTPEKSPTNNRLEKNEKIILVFNYTIIKIINFVISLLVISGIIVIIINLLRNPEKGKEKEIDFKYEKLIANIIYCPKDIYIFKTKEKTKVITEGKNISTENSSREFGEEKTFLLMIQKEYQEISSNNSVKYYYSAFFSQINSTVDNGTNLMLGQCDKKVDVILNKKGSSNLRRAEEVNNILDYSENNSTEPFFKIDFYKNGKIKDIYIPEGFNLTNMLNMKSILNLTIPKLSLDLYVSNIEEEFNKLMNENNKIDEEEEKNSSNRFLNEDEDANYTQNMFLSADSMDLNYDFMQSDLLNSSENKSINQLKEMKYGNVNNEFITFSGSQINTSIIYLVDEEKGRLQSIQQIDKLILSNNTDSSGDEVRNDNNIYNLNEINLEEVEQNMTTEFPKIESSSFVVTKVNNINCSYINDSSLFDKLNFHFNSFKYEKFDENKNSDINLRLLAIKEKFVKDNNLNYENVEVELLSKKRLRELKEENENKKYYGLQNFINSKETYKYNMMGLNLKQNVYTELIPSNGKIKKYIDIILGKVNVRVNLPDTQTNLNIIIQNVNQLSYKMIELILDTNQNIKKKSNEYIEPIIEMEKNTTKLISEFDDFSNILRGPLNNMYNEIKNFTSGLFNELIDLIKNIHQNYTLILNNIIKDKYEIFNEIRKITKNEYINYINNMINNLENFYNDTLKFLNDIRNELSNINDFQIDVLYDIIDSINDSIELFEQFNKKLFLSIEKGIITFKFELINFIENLIGDLLYITDFLSCNINENEFIVKSLDEHTRNESILLLKDFRNIINIIVDLLINNIQKDYESEVSLDNDYSIKFKSIEKVEQYISEIKSTSSDLILEIKKNINFIEKYEIYSNNIDIIDTINNKTLSEFSSNFYKCLKNIIDIKPEFYNNENSEILLNKKKSFDVVNDIQKTLNKEIMELNEYIKKYSENYFKKNLFNMHTNIHYFRKSFFNNEMSFLLNEFEKLVNYSIIVLFKENIKHNFDLGIQYLNDELGLMKFNAGRDKWHYFATTGFIGRVNKFYEIFEDYLALTESEEYLLLLEKYFYKIRNDILGFIDKKIKSINEYYFNTDLYNNNFYYIKQCSDEIYKISDNINNYFNSLNLDARIKLNALELSANTLVEYNNNLTDIFTNIYSDVMSRGTGSPRSRNEDFEWWNWIYPFFGWKRRRTYCTHVGNINLVINNLTDIDNYFLKNTNLMIEKFKNKFKDYLLNFVKYSKNIYDSLYDYTEKKINNNSDINDYIIIYNNIMNDTIENKSNYNLIEKLYDKYKLCSPEIYIDNLEENINLIKDNYYKLYYLKNKSEFLEYPKEIISKINSMSEQIINHKDLIKQKINLLYKTKILQIINIHNKFIYDFNTYNFLYIYTTINSSYIMDNYTLVKIDYINRTFNKFEQNINSNEDLNNEINELFRINKYNILINDNFDEIIKDIINNYYNFIELFEEEINTTFISKECKFENSTEICESILYKSELDYSEYNFNIVKLRTSLYYTKNIIKNLYNLFDDFSFSEIINNKIINKSDIIINDKNILQTSNKLNKKLESINKDTDEILKEPYEFFIQDFSKKFTFENDYLRNIDLFKQILNFTYINYINNISEFNNITKSGLNELLLEFNKTLYNQLNLIYDYDYYNINKNYFKNIFIYYQKLINKSFEQHKDLIIQLDNSYNFKNVIKDVIDIHIDRKIKYSKYEINSFIKPYEIQFLNYSFNLGEYIAKYMKKSYLDYIFKYIYDYVELYENNTSIYTNRLLKDLIEIKNNFNLELEYLYNNFYEEFIRNISNFVNYDYIKNLNDNKSYCSNYSMDKIEEYKKEDKINYEKYINYTNLINKILSECESNKTDIEYNDNYNYNNSKNNCDISEIEEIVFINKTNALLVCDDNNYFNYKVKIFEEFEGEYKNKLDLVNSKIINIIKNRRIDESFLFNFLINEVSYDKYNFILEDISNDFDDIKDISFYINNIKNKEYKDELENNLIINYNESYTKFINDYIIENVLSNLDIIINEKVLMQINYIENNILDNFNYYKLLLSQCNSLGISTKSAFLNLYDSIILKINETINAQIENFLFELDIFYKSNKDLFKNNYLNYVLNRENSKYLYHINEYIDDIMKEISFNQTLYEITNYIFDSIFSKKIKDRINNNLLQKINELYTNIDSIKNEISNILNEIPDKELPKDMNNTIYLINNYNELVYNQQSKFIFSVSDKPFLLIDDFIHKYLGPPLIEIKNKYSLIEIELLNQITEKLNKFPDYSLIVKDNLNLDSKISNITEDIDIFKTYLSEYFIYFMNDINGYFNKLSYLTIINGTNYLEVPCNLSICLMNSTLNDININETNNNFTRRLNENKNINISKYFRSIPELNETNRNFKGDFKRKLQFDSNKYNSDSPPLSKDDIIYFYLFINDSLNEFYENFLSKDYRNLNLTNINIRNKLENIILPKLKRSVDFTAFKFSTVFTKDSMKVLLDKMNYQYNKINTYVSKNYTVLLNKYIQQLLDSLNNTSIFMQLMNNLGFNRIMEVSSKLDELINEKFTVPQNLISIKNPITSLIEEINKKINSNSAEFYDAYQEFLNMVQEQFNKAQESLNKIEEQIKEPIYKILDIVSVINNPNFLGAIKEYIGGEDNYDFVLVLQYHAIEGKDNTIIKLLQFDMFIEKIIIDKILRIECKVFPLLQIRPKIELNDIFIHIDLKLNLIFKDENKYLIDMKDIQVLSKVGVSLYTIAKCEAGLYIPIGIGEMYIAFGLTGLLANINIEMKLSINIKQNKYIINIGFNLIFVGFDFYLKFGIYIDLKIISFRINVYIFYYLILLPIPIEGKFEFIFSFRNKLLEKSQSAKLSLLGIDIKVLK